MYNFIFDNPAQTVQNAQYFVAFMSVMILVTVAAVIVKGK